MFPEFVTVGGFTVYSYGVMLATAFFTAIMLALRRARSVGIEPQVIVDISIVILIGAVVGAKLFYVIGHWSRYAADPGRLLETLRAGGVFQGGLVVAVILAVLYLGWKKQPIWLVADVAAPGIAIGQAIGRVGCFAAGCCYGKPVDHTQVPWAVAFGPDSVAGAAPGVFRHPTQVYESLLMVAVFVALLVLWRYRRFDGQVFWWYVVLYSLVRGGVVEWFRGDHGTIWLGLTGQQLISVATFVVGLLMLLYLARRARAGGVES